MCDEDFHETWICSSCIGEPYLSDLIGRSGELHLCHYCDETRASFSLEAIADLTETAIGQHYVRTADTPSDMEYAWIKHSDGEWERKGDEITDVIENLLITLFEVAHDVQVLLEDRCSDFNSQVIGEECEFESGSHYIERRDDDTSDLDQMWAQFVNSLKTESRYINSRVIATLDGIFKGIADMQAPDAPPLILPVGPDTSVTSLYRARYSSGHKNLEKILVHPDRELGPPPHRLSGTNRMSARGISVFYGASSPDTAISEIRPPVGCDVVSARFNIIRPLRLLNLPALEHLKPRGSMFDPAFIEKCQQIAFLRTLTDRIAVPVMPGDEDFDYLPTQVVAEYLADPTHLGLDGMLYPSVQQSGKFSSDNYNVVLFHKASRVNYLTLPEAENCRVSYGYFTDEGWEMDISVTQFAESSPHSVSSSASEAGTRSEDSRVPALEIDMHSVTVHDIRRVCFKYGCEAVTRRESIPGPDRENDF